SRSVAGCSASWAAGSARTDRRPSGHRSWSRRAPRRSERSRRSGPGPGFRPWLNGYVTERPQVVVLGAGFAGISATCELAKRGFRVTLVDHHPYNTFQPLLYQVATGGLNPGDVTYSLRYFAARRRGVRFRRALVTGIDHDQR